MCWWSLFTSSVSLHSLSTHCHHQFITTLSFFPCRSSTGEKGELSLHPSTSHPFFSYPVVILLFFSLYVLNLWTDWTLGNSPSSLSYNCWIGDLHWTSWELFNYRDCFFIFDFLFIFYFFIFFVVIFFLFFIVCY